MTNIVIINGHPDAHPDRLCSAVARHYARGAEIGGHDIRIVNIGDFDVPCLTSKAEWYDDPLPEGLSGPQADLIWGEHWVIIYPLWMGDMPAKLKAFLEHCLRPSMIETQDTSAKRWTKMLDGRSARVIVTMAMPAVIYRTYFAAHSLKNLERNILKFIGFNPVRTFLFGNVEGRGPGSIERALAKVETFGKAAR